MESNIVSCKKYEKGGIFAQILNIVSVDPRPRPVCPAWPALPGFARPKELQAKRIRTYTLRGGRSEGRPYGGAKLLRTTTTTRFAR